jgi:hypothetical protein
MSGNAPVVPGTSAVARLNKVIIGVVIVLGGLGAAVHFLKHDKDYKFLERHGEALWGPHLGFLMDGLQRFRKRSNPNSDLQ